VKVLKPWTRRGTDSFLGQNYCQGLEIVSLTGKLHRLEPDDGSARGWSASGGDWCGPSLTPNDWKQGRVTFVEKGRNREIGFIEESLSNPEAARFLKISEKRVERLERLEGLERVAVLGRVETEEIKKFISQESLRLL